MSLFGAGDRRPGESEVPMTNDKSITITITVDQTPEEAFAAINDVRGWWLGAIEGPTDALGGEFTFRYQDIHYSKQKVTELVPGRKIAWAITDSALQAAEPKDEWTGTKVVFDIARKGDKTEIRFRHLGLVPDFHCYRACSKGWTYFIQESLRAFIAARGLRPATESQVAIET
jgi:Activator of Hsp90 ATPase homolog 1-like protein